MQRRDPDAVMLRYAELRETLSAPPPTHPFQTQGMRWAATCEEPRCTKMRKDLPEYSRALGRYVMRCTGGHEWRGEPVDAPKRPLRNKERKGAHRGAGFDGRYAELATLERWIHRIPRTERALYWLYLEPRYGGYENAASRANRLEVAGGGWTFHRARRAVGRAREILELVMEGVPRRPEASRAGAR